EVLNKKVVYLSGGQKARLRFLILKMNQPNFFVFDEPTNHLDIDGCEELEAEIIERNSSGIFISHDRRFIRSVATRVLEI
nr:hypothetical protein [Pseudobdellovibrionaceae bacterium]